MLTQRTIAALQRLVVVALVLPSLQYAAAEDSPQWLGPNRDGVSKETDWRDDWKENPARIAWKASVGTGFSSFAVVGERVFTMGYKGGKDSVYCFEAASGKVIWKHEYASKLVDNLHEGGPAATPTVVGDWVYTLGKEGHLFCLAKTDGRVRWKVELQALLGVKMPEWGFSSSPLIHDGRVIVDAGPLTALDAATGKLVWKTENYLCGYGSPVLLTAPKRGTPLIAQLNNNGLLLADAKNGKRTGFFEWKTSYKTNSTTPVISGDKVFISTGYNRGCALLQVSPSGTLTKVYESKTVRNHMDTCVLIDGHLYGIDGNSHNARRLLRFVCLDLATGKERWRESGHGCGTVVAAGDRLIVLGDEGTLAVVRANPERYEEISRQKVLDGRCWTPPVLANGRIYCRNAAGDVVCVDLGATK